MFLLFKQIDRASAGNVKRSREEIDADPEKENQYGYTKSEFFGTILIYWDFGEILGRFCSLFNTLFGEIYGRNWTKTGKNEFLF